MQPVTAREQPILHNSRRRRDKIAKSASYNSRNEDEKNEMKVENAKGMLRLGYSAFAVKLFVRRSRDTLVSACTTRSIATVIRCDDGQRAREREGD